LFKTTPSLIPSDILLLFPPNHYSLLSKVSFYHNCFN
jgi:hypothetical protein